MDFWTWIGTSYHPHLHDDLVTLVWISEEAIFELATFELATFEGETSEGATFEVATWHLTSEDDNLD